MRRSSLFLLWVPIALFAQNHPTSAPALGVELPGPCPEKGPCLAPEEWRLAWHTGVKSDLWVMYDASIDHIRKDFKELFSKDVTLFIQDGQSLHASAAKPEISAYGCQGKLPRFTLKSQQTPEDLGRGSWALAYAKDLPTTPEGIHRRIGRRLKPDAIPQTLQDALSKWKKPSWASDTTTTDSVLTIEMDGDEEKEYWVTRTYQRATYETPAKRMFSSWAIFDVSSTSATMLAEQPEEECDCLCKDGGCGCCRWDETTTTPQALFDADGDGFSEIVLERHQRVGVYRYELWRFDGKKFYQTSLFFEDGSC